MHRQIVLSKRPNECVAFSFIKRHVHKLIFLILEYHEF